MSSSWDVIEGELLVNVLVIVEYGTQNKGL